MTATLACCGEELRNGHAASCEKNETERTTRTPFEGLAHKELVQLADAFVRSAVIRAERAEKRERAWRDAALALEAAVDATKEIESAALAYAVRMIARARAVEAADD